MRAYLNHTFWLPLRRGGWIKSVFSVGLGLSLGLLFTTLAGENPLNVLRILVLSAFGSPYDLGMTLFYTTPLIFTGLSVAVAFHAGLFNIGAEGQLAVGTLCVAAVGIHLVLPPGVAPLVAGLAGVVGGALWGLLAGWLRARRGSHEVIVTMMLNSIAAGLCAWVCLSFMRNPLNQNPETAQVAEAYRLAPWGAFEEAPLGASLLVALLATLAVWIFLERTALGYELRAVGQNARAAQTAGVEVGRIQMIALAIAGALAGLVGVAEVLGHSGAFRLSFSPGYGFIGIAVALLAKNHPFGVIFSAFLFGAIQKGASDLDLETENLTNYLSLIFQGLVILCVSADGLWERLRGRFR